MEILDPEVSWGQGREVGVERDGAHASVCECACCSASKTYKETDHSLCPEARNLVVMGLTFPHGFLSKLLMSVLAEESMPSP